MRRVVIAILLVSTQLAAQQNQIAAPAPQCPLSLKDSPKVRGLKLGMSRRQVERSLKRVINPIETRSYFLEYGADPYSDAGPRKVFTKKPIGQSTYSSLPITGSGYVGAHPGPSDLSLVFFNDSLVQYEVYYDPKEFASQLDSPYLPVIQKLNLPTKYNWAYGRFLTCRDFWISIRYYNAVTVGVSDTKTEKEIRRKAMESVRENGAGPDSH